MRVHSPMAFPPPSERTPWITERGVGTLAREWCCARCGEEVSYAEATDDAGDVARAETIGIGFRAIHARCEDPS